MVYRLDQVWLSIEGGYEQLIELCMDLAKYGLWEIFVIWQDR